MDDQVASALRNLIFKKSNELIDSTNPEELVALAELVHSYTTYLKEKSVSSKNIEKLVREIISRDFHSLKKLFDDTPQY